jgi:hypothetical protein
MTDKLRVTITETSDGLAEYIQIMSADTMSVNIVLIAGKIEVEDCRDDRNATEDPG